MRGRVDGQRRASQEAQIHAAAACWSICTLLGVGFRVSGFGYCRCKVKGLGIRIL